MKGQQMTKRQRERIARLAPDGIPRWVRVYDNGGETTDRYTVVFSGRYSHKTGGEHWVLGMSSAPFSPQGVGLHSSYPEIVDAPGSTWAPAIGRRNHLGLRIPFSDLPTDCRRATWDDYSYLWDIPNPLQPERTPDESATS